MDGGNWGLKAVCDIEQGATLLLENWLTRRGLRKLSSARGGLIMIQTAAVAIDKPGMRPGEETKQDYDNAD